jgi:acetyltransferase
MPYPAQYAKRWIFEDGTEVMIRPICPEDESRIADFHQHVSDRSVYLRYFHMMNLDSRVTHERLKRVCCIDYTREMVLVVEHAGEILAVGRLTKADQGNEGEFALLIADAYQGHGVGTELLHRLVEVARLEKLARVTAEILPENDHMLHVCRQLGFRLQFSQETHAVKAELAIEALQ